MKSEISGILTPDVANSFRVRFAGTKEYKILGDNVKSADQDILNNKLSVEVYLSADGTVEDELINFVQNTISDPIIVIEHLVGAGAPMSRTVCYIKSIDSCKYSHDYSELGPCMAKLEFTVRGFVVEKYEKVS